MKISNKKLFVNENISIQELLKKFNYTGRKTLIVVKKNILIGIITEGDARRALIKKKKLNSNIKNIFNKKPKFLFQKKYSDNKARRILLKFTLDTLPVVDEKKKIIKIVWLNDLLKPKRKKKLEKIKIPLIIMAGGKGTRLKPFTQILPKPLIPLNGKAMVLRIIDQFAKYGVMKFFISINYKSEIIKAFFKEQKDKYKVFFTEEKKPLGTVGGIAILRPKINSNFFLTNCDTLIDYSYNKIYKHHLSKKNDITIVTSRLKVKVPYGIVVQNKNLFQHILEKPTYSFYFNVGLYVFSKKIFDILKKNQKMDINELLQIAKKTLKIGTYNVSSKKIHDTGNWKEFFQSQKRIS